MYLTNIANDYDNITSSNYTNYDNMTLTNYTNSGNNIEILIPLITTIPCGMSFICLISLVAYTLVKSLFIKKRMSLYINDG